MDNIKAFRPAIIQALKSAPPNATPEQTTDLIFAFIDLVGGVLDQMGVTSESRRKDGYEGVALIGGDSVQNQSAKNTNLQAKMYTGILRGDEQSTPSRQWNIAEAPPPGRIRQRKSDAPVRSLEEVQEYIEQNAPPSLTLDLGDGKPPLTLSRRVKVQPFMIGRGQDMGGNVQLVYLLPGERENSESGTRVGDDNVITIPPPTHEFSTADVDLDLGAALDELLEANRARTSRTKREVKAVAPKPIAWSLETAMQSSMSGTAESAPMASQNFNTGEVLDKWRSNMSEKEARVRAGLDPLTEH